MAIESIEQLARLFHTHHIDRRRLLQTASALGLSATGAGAALSHVQPAAAQESSGNLLTISHQQVPNWTRNFNPLLDQDSSRWPTQGGIYEPMLIYNTATSEIVPWLATGWELATTLKASPLPCAKASSGLTASPSAARTSSSPSTT